MNPYYENESGKLYNADCLELMKELEENSIDMILCDLPYGTTACSWDTVIPFKPLWKQYKRIIKDNGAIVLTACQPFTTDLINSNRKWFKYELIWNKICVTNFFNAKTQPLRCHENIIIFGKDIKYNPLLTNNTKKRFGKESNHFCEIYGSKPGPNSQRNVGYPRSIITVRSIINLDLEKRYHPTQKPVKLFEYLILTYTNSGDLVLDNCCGVGTTGIACIKTGREFILIELEEKYCEIARARIEEASKQGILPGFNE